MGKLNRELEIEDKSSQRRAKLVVLIFITLAASSIVGCDSGPPPLTEEQKQQAILDDPMGYKPVVPGDITNTSSHQTHTLGDDVNDVINP